MHSNHSVVKIIHLNYLDAVFLISGSDKYNWNSLANGQGVKNAFLLDSRKFFGIVFEFLKSLSVGSRLFR